MSTWQIVPAIQRDGTPKGQGDYLSSAGKLQRLDQPSYDEKQMDKKEGEDMLPMQKMYYLNKQLDLQQKERGLESEMYNYFYSNKGIPSQTQQQKWNKSLYSLKQEGALLESQSSRFKQNFKDANETRKSLMEDENSTADRIALKNINGRLLPIIGKKENGIGWLTHLEEIENYDYMPGTDDMGMPEHVGPSTAINYSGAFQKHIDERFSKVKDSKTISPIYDTEGKITGYQQAFDIVGDEDLKYMSILTTSGNVDQVRDAANKMMSGVTGQAKLDLASDFYEKLLFAQQGNDGRIHMVLDTEGNMIKSYDGETSKSLYKLLNMQELSQVDINTIDHAMKEYGQYLIMEQVPSQVKIDQVIRDVKIKDDTAKDKPSGLGPMTSLAQNKVDPVGASTTIKKSDGLLSYGQQMYTDKKGNQVPLLRSYPTLNATYTSGFNQLAQTALFQYGGLRPEVYNPNGFFYNSQGVPNSMSLLTDQGVSIGGLTGRIQEMYFPDITGGQGGYEYSIPDMKGKSPEGVLRASTKAIEVILMVPKGSDVLDNIKGLDGLKIKEGILGEQRDLAKYLPDSSGKKYKDFTVFSVWFPMLNEGQMIQWEDDKYQKYTQKAQEDKLKGQKEQIDNTIENLKRYRTK
jgi:hypothetical protein